MSGGYELNTVYDLHTDSGEHTVVGIDYDAARHLLTTTTERRGLIRSENGAIELEPAPRVSLGAAGEARLLSRQLNGPCFEAIKSIVAEPDEWEWVKVTLTGDDIAGVCCLGILHERRDNDGTVVRRGEAIVVTL